MDSSADKERLPIGREGIDHEPPLVPAEHDANDVLDDDDIDLDDDDLDLDDDDDDDDVVETVTEEEAERADGA
jgi:hypothetical protein